jgi:hypothetical protein
MDDHLSSILEQAKRKLAEQELAVIDTKKFINQLCQFGSLPPLYKLDDVASSSSAGIGTIRSDTFYGKSVTTAVREFLEMRRASSLGAASYPEIIQALETGGFDFTTLSADDIMVAKRAVTITLAKNSSIFHKLPNGNWGLLSWYPEAREKKKQKVEVNGSGVNATAPEKPAVTAAPKEAEAVA